MNKDITNADPIINLFSTYALAAKVSTKYLSNQIFANPLLYTQIADQRSIKLQDARKAYAWFLANWHQVRECSSFPSMHKSYRALLNSTEALQDKTATDSLEIKAASAADEYVTRVTPESVVRKENGSIYINHLCQTFPELELNRQNFEDLFKIKNTTRVIKKGFKAHRALMVIHAAGGDPRLPKHLLDPALLPVAIANTEAKKPIAENHTPPKKRNNHAC